MRYSYIPFISLAAACMPGRYDKDADTGDTGDTSAEPPPVETVDNGDGDSNGDGIPDVNQSIGVGHDPVSGLPYVVFFPGNHLPTDTSNLWQIGFGCSVYDGTLDDDWVVPCVRFGQYNVNHVQMGWTFVDPREGEYEGVPYDDNHGLFADLSKLEVSGDPAGFIVSHVDGPDCPVEEQRTAIHYGFRRVGNDVVGLYASVAPPDPTCY